MSANPFPVTAQSGDVPKVVVQEQSGDARTVELSGRALPYRAMSFETEQRAEVTWYPASGVGSLQFLGPMEKPTSLHGMWKDRFIMQAGYGVSSPGLATDFAPSSQSPYAVLDGQPVANVFALVELFVDICRKGQVILFTWMEVSRYGYLKNFKHSWDTANDVSWEMTFEWVSQGADPFAVQFEGNTGDALNFASNSQQVFNDVQAAIAPTLISALNETANEIAAVEDQLQSAIEQAQSAVNNAIDGINAPINAALSLAGTATSMVKNYQQVMGLVTLTIQSDQNAAEYIATSAAGLAARASARVARNAAANQARSIANRVDPTLLAVVTAREGQDLRSFSTQYYGTQAQWRALMTYNNMQSSTCSAGQVVLVPQLTAGTNPAIASPLASGTNIAQAVT